MDISALLSLFVGFCWEIPKLLLGEHGQVPHADNISARFFTTTHDIFWSQLGSGMSVVHEIHEDS